MRIALSTTVGVAARRRVVRFLGRVLAASATVVALGAQESRPVPRFAGKTIPEPPGQSEPWTAPATKLPKFVVNATGILFEQGVADPRGCAYREVEVGGDWIVKVHGFVLPERADVPGRFVICWDGLVYPALTVGATADLDRDVHELAASMKQAHDAAQANRFNQGFSWRFSRERPIAFREVGVDDNSPLKLCLLLRLGRADLAEALFAAGMSWSPAVRARDLTDYGISYLTLAADWAGSAFKRLIGARVKGDDVIALDTARKLAKFRDMASAKADAMGFPRPDRSDASVNGGAVPRFYFLSQLDDLLRDQERRAKMPARGPIPGKGGDPAARIAALIRDLDQIDVQQMSSPGSAYPGHSPLVYDLIALGDAAVPPLLEVLESDNRLTRSVSNGRGNSLRRFVHPVAEAALAGLIGILKTHEFDSQSFSGSNARDPATRRALAASVRQFWERTRAVPLVERWYRTLRDDSAGPARWLEAAGAIAQPEVKPGMPLPQRGTQPMQGEPLRAGRDPSVTDLIIRRAKQIERMGNPQMSYDQEFARACGMGFTLASWDKTSSLPLLKDLMKKCRARSDDWLARADNGSADRALASYLATFTELRLGLGDLAVLDEYASWLRTTTPKMLEYTTLDALEPLLAHADHPALASAARWLFSDPKSPWVPLLPEARAQQTPPFQNLFASPLIVVAGFRAGVFIGLADKAPLGTLKRKDGEYIEREIKNVPTTSYSSTNLNLEGVSVGVEYPFRRCDYLASNLSELEGCPRFDLFWSEARRDEGVAACAAYLKRFGASFTAKLPAGEFDHSGARAHLRFPTLGKPATPEDVASARAIFSLAAEGETRLANMPVFPLKAKWLTLTDTPVVRSYSVEGSTKADIRHEYDSDGYVWQAEEVRKGDRWERFYGFVGHHVVSRAPASEIEFASGFGPWWWNLKGGLDARAELVDPPTTSYEPGRPIVVALHIRNRLGTAHASPTEFIGRAPDGKPAIRKGINLLLWHSMSRGPNSSPNQAYPRDVVQPRRHDHFEPGNGARPLAPLESFEAMRLDLNDWFDVTKPGQYRFRASFAADSGVGEGAATEAHFQVGEEE